MNLPILLLFSQTNILLCFLYIYTWVLDLAFKTAQTCQLKFCNNSIELIDPFKQYCHLENIKTSGQLILGALPSLRPPLNFIVSLVISSLSFIQSLRVYWLISSYTFISQNPFHYLFLQFILFKFKYLGATETNTEGALCHHLVHSLNTCLPCGWLRPSYLSIATSKGLLSPKLHSVVGSGQQIQVL